MASSPAIYFFLLPIAVFSVSCLSQSHAPNSKPNPFILPIKKDPSTNVFYTSLGIGTPRHNMDLGIDLAGENLWYDCNKRYNSSTYRPISCNSKSCPRNTNACGLCHGPFKPGCTNDTCGTSNYNPLAQIIFHGDLGVDILFISQIQMPGFISGCTDSHALLAIAANLHLLQGLPKSNKGIIGLSRSQIGLPTQLALAMKLPPKFSLCLPSSNNIGFTEILIGAGEGHPRDVSKYVQTTSLLVNPGATSPVSDQNVPSAEYFIDVKSIKIDGRVVDIRPSLLSIDKKGNGGTKISTITSYAKLLSPVYKPFVQEFLKRAAERRLKRVASEAPFEACFDSSTIGNSISGLDVPKIDLVLHGGVKWTIHGANSMVTPKKNVACLAFVDVGTVSTMTFVQTPIIIGAHQLEENLLVFDLVSNKLSFSSSLLQQNASCSHL